MALEEAGVSVQHPSLRLANNRLGSASLLLKKQPGGRRSTAGLSRQGSGVFPLQETWCPGVGNYHAGTVGFTFTTGQVVSEPLDFISELALHLHSQSGMVRWELICVRIEGVNDYCRLGAHCYLLILSTAPLY